MMLSSSSESRLPTGFREVQWLQGTGTQYCETGINPVNTNANFTSIKGDITLLDKANSAFCVGTYWTETSPSTISFNYSCEYASSSFEFHWGRTSTANTNVNLNNEVFPIDLHFEINKNNLILNQNSYTKYDQINYNAWRQILIGANYNAGGEVTVYNNQVKIKNISVYNNDTLLYQFVPCYRKSDGKTGFCKITVADGSTVFLENEGEDEWIIGPVV